MSEWRYRYSAHGDRKHYSPITTAGRKKHLFHLTKRVSRPDDPSACGCARTCRSACVSCREVAPKFSRSFARMQETPIPPMFLRMHRGHENACAIDFSRRKQRRNRFDKPRARAGIACEKKFRGQRRAKGLGDRFRRESSESPASDSFSAPRARRVREQNFGAAVAILTRGRRRETTSKRATSRCGEVPVARSPQMPSLPRKSSFTMLGLALPSDAFIT